MKRFSARLFLAACLNLGYVAARSTGAGVAFETFHRVSETFPGNGTKGGLGFLAGTAKPDYNEETYVGNLAISIETMFAVLFVGLISSLPFVLVSLVGGQKLTKAHAIESVCLILWLGFALFMFTNILKFNSSHWSGARTLTIVEAVYLLSQILTTVGYGDITPAYPRGQVWIAINVIMALCLYGSIIMEVSQRLSDRFSQTMQELVEDCDDDDTSVTSPKGSLKMKEWVAQPRPLEWQPFAKSLAAFTVLVTIGVIFWHYYPGEGKTWLQAIYMSVITLSTVGFGWFNATTEGGKVFGAFWMLFGVATLAASITSFVDLMGSAKARERRNVSEEKLKFYRYVKMCCRTCPSLGGDCGMDEYDFLKFGLLLNGIVTEEELEQIGRRFSELHPNSSGTISCEKVAKVEGPPTDVTYGVQSKDMEGLRTENSDVTFG